MSSVLSALLLAFLSWGSTSLSSLSFSLSCSSLLPFFFFYDLAIEGELVEEASFFSFFLLFLSGDFDFDFELDLDF